MKHYFIPALLGLNILFLLFFFIVGSYPNFIILLHFASLVILFFYAANAKMLWQFVKKNKIEIVFVAFLFVLGFAIRIFQIDVVTPGLQGDELVLPGIGLKLLKSSSYLPYFYESGGHGTLLPYLLGMSITIFGKSIFALRFPSILFGVFSIVAFYIFLRIIFKKNTAFIGSLFFVFSYAHIALSRLAFESAESIFFQIVSGIFLYLSIKMKQVRYYVGLGVSLAIGNYTYLDFRVFTLISLIIMFGFSVIQKKSLYQKIYPFIIVVIVFISSASPLLHYSLVHKDQLATRPSMVSIFNQGLTSYQISRHLLANLQKTLYVFIPPGDPNGRINPGNTAMFDFVTTLLFLLGFLYIFRKQKVLFLILCFMFFVPIISDVFTKESGAATGGPNAFNGFGHPNTMRIEGVIPLVLFITAFGISEVQHFLKKFNAGFFMVVIICFSAFINYVDYFDQPFNGYTYSVNGVNELSVVDYINKNLQGRSVYLSPNLIQSPFVTFFIKDKKDLHVFNPSSFDDALLQIQASDATIIDKSTDNDIITKLYGKGDLPHYTFSVQTYDSKYFQDLIYIKN